MPKPNYFDRLKYHIYTLQPQEREKILQTTKLSALIEDKEYIGSDISKLAASAKESIEKSTIKNKRDVWYRFRIRELRILASAKEEEKPKPNPSLSPLVEDLENILDMFPPSPYHPSSDGVPNTPINFNAIAASFASPSVENQRKKRKFEVDTTVSSLHETSILASASKVDIQEQESDVQFLQRYVTNTLNGTEEPGHSFFNHIDPTYRVVLDDLEDHEHFAQKLNNNTNLERRRLASSRYNVLQNALERAKSLKLKVPLAFHNCKADRQVSLTEKNMNYIEKKAELDSLKMLVDGLHKSILDEKEDIMKLDALNEKMKHANTCPIQKLIDRIETAMAKVDACQAMQVD